MLPIDPRHFDSEVAKTVFNDVGAPPSNPMIGDAEVKLYRYMMDSSPNKFRKISASLDSKLIPHMSPSMMRRVAQFIFAHMPQILKFMPNLDSYVRSMNRAVYFSKFLHPSALDRIVAALEKEGLTQNK